ncbi:MAG: sodium ion-translocating decarboxylase subunit beta [Paludibacter sp.]|nr:sodium ion-translocating decarboxylase subunit beta [Paludibacter sp.]
MSKNIKNLSILLILFTLFIPFNLFGQGTTEVSSIWDSLAGFWVNTGFANFQFKYLVMIIVGIAFILMGIIKHWEPLLLVPIGFGIIFGNIPFTPGYNIGIYEEGSVLNILYGGVIQGWYPPLIFLGIGAMTDFSSLISNPKLMLLGAAAQMGIFLTFIGAYAMGFTPAQSGAIAIIGGADGPTAIFLSSKLAPELIGAIAVAAYSYMALVPLIQPPIMKLLIPKKERIIRMKPPRAVSKTEKIAFPIIGMLLTTFISPSALPLLGMLFFGNLLKESGVTERLAETARFALINAITILLGLTVGASTQADRFLTADSMKIFVLGAVSFVIATSAGLIFARIMNLFLKGDNKINPLIGAAGVSAVPDSARVVQEVGLHSDKNNHLLMHAMAPNVSGVIGSAVAAGILLSMLA